MTDWLATLAGSVAEAGDALQSGSVGVQRKRDELQRCLHGALSRLQEVTWTGPQEWQGIVDRHRALELARQRRFAEMSLAERKCAARALDDLDAEVLSDLLAFAPRCAKQLVRAALTDWHRVVRARNPKGIGRLVEENSSQLPGALIQVLPPAYFGRLAVEEATLEHLRRVKPQAVRLWLEGVGLSLRWSLTGHIVARWIEEQERARDSLDQFWYTLLADPEMAACLLPKPRGSEEATGSGHSPLEVRCRIGLALLRAGLAPWAALSRSNLEALIERLLASELDDPRIPPESEGWRVIRRLDSEIYQTVLQELVREDIEIFFEHAMHRKDRRDFWLGYVRTIRRTVCLLCPSTYVELTRLLAASPDQRLRAAAKRANRLKNGSAVNAFVIYFDRIVVVEFSEQNNAAYVYDRPWFERQFGPSLSESTLTSANDLKIRREAKERISHGHGWKGRAEDFLWRFGVSRRPHP